MKNDYFYVGFSKGLFLDNLLENEGYLDLSSTPIFFTSRHLENDYINLYNSDILVFRISTKLIKMHELTLVEDKIFLRGNIGHQIKFFSQINVDNTKKYVFKDLPDGVVFQNEGFGRHIISILRTSSKIIFTGTSPHN